MASTKLSFAKVATVGSTGLEIGRIYFETSTGLIKVAKSATEVDAFGGVREAKWDKDTQHLVITNANGNKIDLDLSDVASATEVTSAIAGKLNIGSDSDTSDTVSYHGLKKYTDEAKAAAINTSKTYTDQKIGEIPEAIVYKGDETTITQSGSSTVTFSVGTIAQSKVSGLESALAGKAAKSHTHTKAQITDFNEADYATAAQGKKADTALQSVSASGAGNLTLSVASKSGTTQAISGSLNTSTVSSNGTGLTTASDVKTYVDSAVNKAVSSALKYKGSCTYAELPKSPAQGDVYNVTDKHGNVPAGTNYAWNGESWDALAGSVDLSPYLTISSASSTYATKTELTSGLEGKANTSHKHAIADVTDLQSALDAKVPITRTVNGKALSANVVVGGGDIVVGGKGDYAKDTVQEAIDALKTAVDGKVDTNTTYTFANGADGSFTVTPSTGSAQKVTIGKPATAGTADKVGHGLTVSLNGTAQTKFDGSADVAFNITAASVGAAAASHTHSNYVPTTRTINKKALSADITLTAADVNADAAGSATSALNSAKSYADGLWVWANFE